MIERNFEDKIKDLLHNHEEAAPDVMNKIFEKRTPLYVFRNKLVLHKYKLIAATLGLAFLLFMFTRPNSIEQNQGTANQTTGDINISSSNPTIAEKAEKASGLATDTKVDGQSQSDMAAISDQPVQIENVPTGSWTTVGDENQNAIRNDEPAAQSSSSNKNALVSTPSTGEQETTSNPSENDQVVTTDNSTTTSEEEASSDNQSANQIAETTDNASNKADDDMNTNDVQDVADAATNTSNEANEVNADDDEGNATESNNDEQVAQVEATDGDGDNTIGGDEFVPAKPIQKWSIGLSYGGGVGDRNFDNSQELKSIVAREETEKQKYSHAAELTLNYKASSNIEVFTGVSFFDRRENMSFEKTTNETRENITSRQVIEYHPIYGPRQRTVYDTTYQTVEVKRNVTSANSYKHLTVPLGLRYTLYGKRIGFYLSGNVGMEILTKTSGSVVNGDFEEVTLNNKFARTTLGANVGAGMGLSYLLNDRFTAIFEPRATFYLSPTNGNQYSLNQWDQGYTVFLGLKYGF